MKFTCPVSALKKSLSQACRAVPTRPVHPILANVKIDVSPQTIAISGFDLSIGIQSQFIGAVEQTGSITVPAKLLNDVIDKIPSGDVTLDNTKAGECLLTISSGTSIIKIQGCSADEFPDLPIEKGVSYQFPVDAFRAGIHGSLLACSEDETKYVLQGVNLKISAEGSMTFAAADGHRLGKIIVPAPASADSHDTSEEYELTIPSTALQHIQAMLGKSGELEMQCASDRINFRFEDWVLTSRILDGKYPAYESLIAKTFQRSVTFNRLAIIESLQRLSVFTPHTNNVTLAIDSDTSSIHLSTENELGSNGKEKIYGQIEGTSIDVSFNIKYLIEGLKSLVTNTVLMEMNGHLNPVVFTTIGHSPKGLHLVMPVRT